MKLLRRHPAVASTGTVPVRLLHALALGLLLAALGAPRARAQGNGEPAQTMAFVYNFGKFTEWPPAALGAPGKPITLCMMGDTEYLTQALAEIDSHTMQGREVRVRHMSRLGEPAGCQILFVAHSEEKYLGAILPAAHANATLTVSDIADFADLGGIVGIAISDGKLEFDVNATVARQAGLRLSSQVLKLARTVLGK